MLVVLVQRKFCEVGMDPEKLGIKTEEEVQDLIKEISTIRDNTKAQVSIYPEKRIIRKKKRIVLI